MTTARTRKKISSPARRSSWSWAMSTTARPRLLDAIRKTHVTAGEAGGITQHIGAYTRKRQGQGDHLPGHPGPRGLYRHARTRRADLPILPSSSSPQTTASCRRRSKRSTTPRPRGCRSSSPSTKSTSPAPDPDRVKQELTQYELVPEEWGGDTICVPVSAVQGTGINELLEMIILSADMMELKANPSRAAKGVVIEAKLDKGRGAVATVLVAERHAQKRRHRYRRHGDRPCPH